MSKEIHLYSIMYADTAFRFGEIFHVLIVLVEVNTSEPREFFICVIIASNY